MKQEQRKIQLALKTLMKKWGMTYQSIAHVLRVSTATVKRRLNGREMTIGQLREFAEALSVSFYDLIELSKMEGTEPHLFTPEQEGVLAKKITYVQTLRMVLMGKPFRKIQDQLDLNEAKLRKILRELEKAGLMRLLQGDRIVASVRFPFRWQAGGALEHTYTRHIHETIAKQMITHGGQAGLHKKFELLLSPETHQLFCAELERTFLKYRNLSEIYMDSKIGQRQLVSGVLFADTFSAWGDESPQP